MELTLATAQEAAIGFVRQLGPLDVAAVVDFDSRVQIVHDFTANGASLEEAIRRTSAGGSTALYNAVYIALKELNKVRPEDNTQYGHVAGRLLSCRMERTPRALSLSRKSSTSPLDPIRSSTSLGWARTNPQEGRSVKMRPSFCGDWHNRPAAGRSSRSTSRPRPAWTVTSARNSPISIRSRTNRPAHREMGNGVASRFA